MKLLRKFSVLWMAVLVFGAARMGFERALTDELRKQRLFSESLEIDTRDKIGQTSSAVALGGLRTLVATFLNLRGYTYFTQQRWDDVAATYDMVVDLAPRTRYYWEAGAWHQAYNAASYYSYQSDLPPFRRKELWRASILRGRAFLERGIRNNPNDWNLHAQLGLLLLDANKFVAFRDKAEVFSTAAEAFRIAEACGNAFDYVSRFRMYALARVEGREAEALSLARELYAKGAKYRPPTLLCLLLVLEAHQDPKLDVASCAVELFGNAEKAYGSLCLFWMRPRDRYPMTGLALGLKGLESLLQVPDDQSVFKKPQPSHFKVEDWFQD